MAMNSASIKRSPSNLLQISVFRIHIPIFPIGTHGIIDRLIKYGLATQYTPKKPAFKFLLLSGLVKVNKINNQPLKSLGYQTSMMARCKTLPGIVVPERWIYSLFKSWLNASRFKANLYFCTPLNRMSATQEFGSVANKFNHQ